MPETILPEKSLLKRGLLSNPIFRRFPPGVWMVTLIGVLNSASFSLSLPFLSLYLHTQRDVSMTMVGLFILGSGIIASAAQMMAGMLSDRIGRRPIILGSMTLAGSLFVVMAYLINAVAPVWAIVTAYFLVRCGLMAARPATQALIVDLMPKARLAEGYGILRMGQNLGFGFGPAIGGYFWAAGVSYAWLFVGAAVVSSICILVTFTHLKESHFGGGTEQISFSAALATAKDRTFLMFTIISVIAFMGLGQFISTLSVYTVERVGFSTVQYGSLLTLNAILVVALQYPATRWINKFDRATALLLGMSVYTVGYLTMGFVGPYAWRWEPWPSSPWARSYSRRCPWRWSASCRPRAGADVTRGSTDYPRRSACPWDRSLEECCSIARRRMGLSLCGCPSPRSSSLPVWHSMSGVKSCGL